MEFADQADAGKETPRQVEHGAQPGDQRDILELADVDEPEVEPGFGDKAGLHAASGAYEEDFGGVARDQFTGYGECRDDVSASAASGDKYAQFRQRFAFRMEMYHSFSDSPGLVSFKVIGASF
jgi:hypothetical protein